MGFVSPLVSPARKLASHPPAFTRNADRFQAPPNSLGGVGEINEVQTKSLGRFGWTSSPTPFADLGQTAFLI